MASLDLLLTAETLHTWRINHLQGAKERIEGTINATVLLVPTGLRHPHRPGLIVSVNPDGWMYPVAFLVARVDRARPATPQGQNVITRVVLATIGVDVGSSCPRIVRVPRKQVLQPFHVVEVGPPLVGPTSMYQVAVMHIQVHLLMRPIADRKDRMNIVIAIDLIAPTPLKTTTRKKNQYLEMLVKVTLRIEAQAHIVIKISFLLNPGVKARRVTLRRTSSSRMQ